MHKRVAKHEALSLTANTLPLVTAPPPAPHLMQAPATAAAPQLSSEPTATIEGEPTLSPTVQLGHSFSRLPLFAPQSKLTVNAPDDPFEQEADAVAEAIVGMEQSPPIQEGGTQAQTMIQRARGDGSVDAPEVSNTVAQGLSGTAQPLDTQTRTAMELRFGHDFSRVRIYADEAAAQSAQRVAARAYTVGPHIAFNHGEYDPQSGAGRRLLAHELTHVVQQGAAPLGGDASQAVQRKPLAGSVGPMVQRDPDPQQGIPPPAASTGSGQGIPDFSKMPWTELLPHTHGDKKDKQIAEVQNTPKQAPTLKYDDKHLVTDPVAGTPSTDPADAQKRQAFEAAMTTTIEKISAARASIPPRDINRNPYGTPGGNFYDPIVPGWAPKPTDDPKQTPAQWRAEQTKQKPTDDPQGADYQKWANQAKPTGLDVKNADDVKKWDIFKATMPLEGRLGTITTFDKTLTTGVGFSSSGGQAQTVIGKTLNVLPEMQQVAFNAGLIADGKGGMQVVDTERKWILAGKDAAAYVQTNESLLSLLINVSQGVQPDAAGDPVSDDQQATQRQAWLDAQWQTFFNNALKDIPANILAWPMDSVVLVTHSRHGYPGEFPWSFWSAHPASDLHAIVTAMYDALALKKYGIAMFDSICGGMYKSIADNVKAEKARAATPAATP